MAALQSWADDVESQDAPKRTETVDANGIVTIVEYKLNDEGKKVKVTRRIKRTLVKTVVNHQVAERMAWSKFGAERGHKAGPDTATTVVGENIRLRLQAGGIKKVEAEEDENERMRRQLASKKITCRLCQGGHYTTRCPYKDTLGGVLGEGDPADNTDPTATDAPGASSGGKYVPPSQRLGAKGGGESMNSRANRDDLPTLRVTNLSEDATESDLWELFQRFGSINRIYVGKDQETGLCKGFAFVSFENRAEAEKAMAKINGLPYDHLILACAWSVPKTEVAGGPGGGR